MLTVAAAVGYGIIHDETTAHLCVEYFTLGHPDLFHTQSPAILGLFWGVAAPIGVGAIFGALLAEASQSGSFPPMPIHSICRSLFILLTLMGASAAFAGFTGFYLARHAEISLPPSFEDLILPSLRDRFMAVWFAHCASYLAGIVGGSLLIFHIWNERGRPQILHLVTRTKFQLVRALFLAGLGALILYLRFRP